MKDGRGEHERFFVSWMQTGRYLGKKHCCGSRPLWYRSGSCFSLLPDPDPAFQFVTDLDPTVWHGSGSLPVPDTASYIRGWIQMVLTPNDLFSWNNKYSKYTIILLQLYTSTTDSLLSFSCTHQLTLCMLAFWSCEGVVFLVLSSSSHFTTYHVFPLPLSGANWRSLSWLWGSGPPFPKMAPLFTGSAHTPLPGSNTLPFQRLNVPKTVLFIHLNLIFFVSRFARTQPEGTLW
jgi:hypothetical protein